ncbi:MAG TPA: DUF2279 domain-containing protein [Rubricoccaceae bacterium]|nr:DUF2279 domain-containing protein [Rubricoccaceae bacterium]
MRLHSFVCLFLPALASWLQVLSAQPLAPPPPDSVRTALAADSLPHVAWWQVAPAPTVPRTGLVLGAGVSSAGLEYVRRLADDRRLTGPFSVRFDWSYARWADKPGHVYSSQVLSTAFATGYRWAGYGPRRAALLGAATGFAGMVYYETLDGFGRNEHFSPGDIAANAIGAGLVAARAHVPALDAVHLKVSYWPSGDPCDPSCDYEGQIAWLAVNPRALGAHPLPPWLNVAAGYAVRDGDIRYGFDESHVLVGLDLEPAGLPIRGKLWDALVPWLRFVHFPAPAVRITPRPRFLLLAY